MTIMMIEPPIDTLIKKVGNPYQLAVIVSKRALYLEKVMPKEVRQGSIEVEKAIDDVYEDKIKFSNNEN